MTDLRLWFEGGTTSTYEGIFECSQDGKSILSDDPNLKLSAQDRAKLTISSFFEMCKQGRGEEAIARYVSAPDEAERNFLMTFDGAISYSVSDARTQGSYLEASAGVNWVDRGSPTLIFQCSQDGSQILRAFEAVVPS